MNAYDVITTRRSIRKYQEKAVDQETVKKLIEAGMQAPSAVNTQPWHFIVIDDQAKKDKILQYHQHAQMIRQAPLGILVCGDVNIVHAEGYLPQDCSAATENILLAAHALGLGAVWLGIYTRPERMNGMKELFGLPENIEPFSLISIGYPAEEKSQPKRYKEERVHKNHW